MTGEEKKTPFHSGFISIVGRPNVGKSTLLNALVGEKVAIVTPKPQTTRNRIIGILNQPDAQMVFVDTPGIHKPRTKLGEYMEQSIQEAMKGIDALLVVLDATRISPQDQEVVQNMRAMKVPKILVLNKIDLVHPQELLRPIADFADAGYDAILPLSARTGDGVDILKQELIARLPEGPAYFPPSMWTDQTERQFVAELIREQALFALQEEIPHGIGVEVLSMKDISHEMVEIYANLFCERDAHKRIIIGKQGKMLGAIGTKARAGIEKLLGKKVNLQLWVKVRPDWRNAAGDLRTLGYSE
ncbi:MAG: GTPase Era [Clostridiales bacterium]|mgnify:CR=1 FL=1|nr:GTPase Era [Clostridiales bacterium]